MLLLISRSGSRILITNTTGTNHAYLNTHCYDLLWLVVGETTEYAIVDQQGVVGGWGFMGGVGGG